MDSHFPQSPLAAATHRDPYGFYRELVLQRPLYFDSELHMWVASSAQTVTAVLRDSACRVRPPGEPVPTALLGSVAAEIFGRRVRMNDDGARAAHKRVLSEVCGRIDLTQLPQRCARAGERLLPGGIDNFNLGLSVYVLGEMMGIRSEELGATLAAIDTFARGIAAGAGAAQVARAKSAALDLDRTARQLLRGGPYSHGDGLLALIHAQGMDADLAVANAIGLLQQTYEATAGLIGNTLLALRQYSPTGYPLPAIIQEVSRIDSPVQSTRRFVARAADVAGAPMCAGDAIVVLLAAANHDPAVHLQPERFDPSRNPHPCFTFGLGEHACLGRELAMAIAVQGVRILLDSGLDPARLPARVAYRPSLATRVPMLDITLTEGIAVCSHRN